MRITNSTTMLTSAQWDWVLANPRQEYRFGPGEVRVCMTFEHPDGIEHAHREITVGEFVRVISKLQQVSRLAEAALTPDALPDVWPPCDH